MEGEEEEDEEEENLISKLLIAWCLVVCPRQTHI